MPFPRPGTDAADIRRYFGLLLGALGVAGLRTGELPPPLAKAAIVAAVPNLLAPIAIAVPQAVYLVPAGGSRVSWS